MVDEVRAARDSGAWAIDEELFCPWVNYCGISDSICRASFTKLPGDELFNMHSVPTVISIPCVIF